MRLLTSKQIRKIEHKGYTRGIRLGYDLGYRIGWEDKHKRDGLDAVIIEEIDALLRSNQ